MMRLSSIDARELAVKADGYWEWVNPGELVFVRN